jgi:hypothetical protein
MSPLAAAVIDELRTDPEGLRELALALSPYLTRAPSPPQDDGWLDARAASEYLGLSLAGADRRPHALHKLTAARDLDFEQECPGGRLYFRRSALDAYRRGERQR